MGRTLSANSDDDARPHPVLSTTYGVRSFFGRPNVPASSAISPSPPPHRPDYIGVEPWTLDIGPWTCLIVFNYLVMIVGPRAGTQFLLDESKQNRIGRGLDCDIILADPLASRVHAIVFFQEGWWVRDAGSRNGTFVNEQKIDEARLVESNLLKIGSTEFEFRQTDARMTDHSLVDHTLTVIRDRTVSADEQPGLFGLEALRDTERAHDFLTLH